MGHYSATPDFLTKVSNIKPSKDSLLAITIGVDALYTNINNQDGLEEVSQSFLNKERFLQTYGTPTGRKFASNYANLFMALWEK